MLFTAVKNKNSSLLKKNNSKKLLYTPEVQYVELNIDGAAYTAIVQDSQYHPITDKLLHVDFLEVVDGKPITIEIPFKLTGTSPGVLKGGFLKKELENSKFAVCSQTFPNALPLTSPIWN